MPLPFEPSHMSYYTDMSETRINIESDVEVHAQMSR